MRKITEIAAGVLLLTAGTQSWAADNEAVTYSVSGQAAPGARPAAVQESAYGTRRLEGRAAYSISHASADAVTAEGRAAQAVAPERSGASQGSSATEPAAAAAAAAIAPAARSDDDALPRVNGKVIREEKLPSMSQEELRNRSHVDSQLYPAGAAERGTDSFYTDQDAADAADAEKQRQKLLNTAPVITTENGERVLSDGNGRPLLDENGKMIKAPLEQIREVSVTLLTTLDNAVLDAFKSLAGGITLGLGTSLDKFTVSDVAPAVRGISVESDGSLVVSLSVQSTEAVLKRNGSIAWEGLSNPVLVWMATIDESNNLDLVSGQNLSNFAASLISSAPDYKYRIMFPILDLEDMQKVQIATVLDHNDQALAAAAERYGSDYFIAAALNTSSDGGVTLKWNLLNRKGENIANAALSGMPDEVASLSAGDIARALMSHQQQLRLNPPEGDAATPVSIAENNVDLERVGAGEGFIRMRMAEVNSLADIETMRAAFISYGYDGDIRIIGYDSGYMVLELVTNSNISNLEGTIRRSGDFNYLAPWTYSLKNSSGRRETVMRDGLRSITFGTVGAERKAPAGRRERTVDIHVRQASFAPIGKAESKEAREEGSTLIVRGE